MMKKARKREKYLDLYAFLRVDTGAVKDYSKLELNYMLLNYV